MTSPVQKVAKDSVEVPARRPRRRFTVEEKTRIVQEAAQCRAVGEIGSLQRRGAPGQCVSLAPTAGTPA